MIAERGRRVDRVAVDPAAPAGGGPLSAGGVDTGAARRQPERALALGRYRPRSVALVVGDILQRRAAQATSRRQERDRLDAVGFSGAVRAEQHYHVPARRNARRAIIAEVREGEAMNAGGGHGSQSSLPGLTRQSIVRTSGQSLHTDPARSGYPRRSDQFSTRGTNA